MGRPLGSKNRTPAELKLDADIQLAKAKLKMLEAKKKQEQEAKRAGQKKVAVNTMPKV